MTDTVDLEKLRIAVKVAHNAYEYRQDAVTVAQNDREIALDRWSQARIDLGHAKGHPLAGKRVKRVIRRFGTGTIVAERTGTVTLYTGLRQGFEIRGHAPLPGEWYVASKSGATGYELNDDWEVIE